MEGETLPIVGSTFPYIELLSRLRGIIGNRSHSNPFLVCGGKGCTIIMEKRVTRQATKAKGKAKKTRRAAVPLNAVPLKTKSEDVKRAPRSSKKRTEPRARREKPQTSPFNPITAVMDAQIRLAAAMVRCSPFGLFLGGARRERNGEPRQVPVGVKKRAAK